MDVTVVVLSVAVLIILFLFSGIRFRPLRWTGQVITKYVIGALLLFFFNVLFGGLGFHIPINLLTAGIIGFLGLFGLISLCAIHLFLL